MRTVIILASLVAALATHAADWEIFQLGEERFSIAFPEPPTEASIEIETIFGPTAMNTYSVDRGSQAFFVAYYDVPAGSRFSASEILDAERDRGLGNTRTTLVTDNPFSAGDYSGRALVADSSSDELRVRVRNFMIGRRVYSLVAVGSSTESMEVAAARFFDSFSLSTHADNPEHKR